MLDESIQLSVLNCQLNNLIYLNPYKINHIAGEYSLSTDFFIRLLLGGNCFCIYFKVNAHPTKSLLQFDTISSKLEMHSIIYRWISFMMFFKHTNTYTILTRSNICNVHPRPLSIFYFSSVMFGFRLHGIIKAFQACSASCIWAKFEANDSCKMWIWHSLNSEVSWLNVIGYSMNGKCAYRQKHIFQFQW